MSSIFDILGPIMVGPSSSHTAGAVRIGYTARQLFGEPVKKAEVYLHGSFAATGEGHGTDKAIIAGLLGMKPDDLRIPDSFTVAEENGMEFTIAKKEIRGAHPNTARVIMENGADKKMVMQAYSIGGGRIRVSVLDGIEVDFSGESNTLIVRNMDRPGDVYKRQPLMCVRSIPWEACTPGPMSAARVSYPALHTAKASEL